MKIKLIILLFAISNIVEANCQINNEDSRVTSIVCGFSHNSEDSFLGRVYGSGALIGNEKVGVWLLTSKHTIKKMENDFSDLGGYHKKCRIYPDGYDNKKNYKEVNLDSFSNSGANSLDAVIALTGIKYKKNAVFSVCLKQPETGIRDNYALGYPGEKRGADGRLVEYRDNFNEKEINTNETLTSGCLRKIPLAISSVAVNRLNSSDSLLPGMSGGALINKSGLLIGILKSSSNNTSTSIPLSSLKGLIKQRVMESFSCSKKIAIEYSLLNYDIETISHPQNGIKQGTCRNRLERCRAYAWGGNGNFQDFFAPPGFEIIRSSISVNAKAEPPSNKCSTNSTIELGGPVNIHFYGNDKTRFGVKVWWRSEARKRCSFGASLTYQVKRINPRKITQRTKFFETTAPVEFNIPNGAQEFKVMSIDSNGSESVISLEQAKRELSVRWLNNNQTLQVGER